jgi:hypothetical protein
LSEHLRGNLYVPASLMQLHKGLLNACAEKRHASWLKCPKRLHICPLVPFGKGASYVPEYEFGFVRNRQRIKSSLDTSLFQFLTPPSFKRAKAANRNCDGDTKSNESEQLRPTNAHGPYQFAASLMARALECAALLIPRPTTP